MQRNIRKLIAEAMPLLEPHLDELLPRKAPLYVAKCVGHVNLVIVNKEPLFYQIRDAHYMPTLRVLHRFPDILPKVQVDRGVSQRTAARSAAHRPQCECRPAHAALSLLLLCLGCAGHQVCAEGR